MNYKNLLKILLILTVVVVSASCVSAGLFGGDGNALLGSGEYKVGNDLPAGEYYVKCNGYNLYVGITKSNEIAKKIKEFYQKDGYSIYIKENIESNKQFLSILSEYDKIANITSDNDIKEIEKIVISNYKEMVLKDET